MSYFQGVDNFRASANKLISDLADQYNATRNKAKFAGETLKLPYKHRDRVSVTREFQRLRQNVEILAEKHLKEIVRRDINTHIIYAGTVDDLIKYHAYRYLNYEKLLIVKYYFPESALPVEKELFDRFFNNFKNDIDNFAVTEEMRLFAFGNNMPLDSRVFITVEFLELIVNRGGNPYSEGLNIIETLITHEPIQKSTNSHYTTVNFPPSVPLPAPGVLRGQLDFSSANTNGFIHFYNMAHSKQDIEINETKFSYYSYETILFRIYDEIKEIQNHLKGTGYIIDALPYPIISIDNYTINNPYTSLMDLVARGQQLTYSSLLDLSVGRSTNTCVRDLFCEFMLLNKDGEPRKKRGRYSTNYEFEDMNKIFIAAMDKLWPNRDIIGGFNSTEIVALAQELGIEYIKIYAITALYEFSPVPLYYENFDIRNNHKSSFGGLCIIITNNHVYRFTDKMRNSNGYMCTIHPTLKMFNPEKSEYFENIYDFINAYYGGAINEEVETAYIGRSIYKFHIEEMQRGKIYPVLGVDNANHVTSFIFDDIKVKYVPDYMEAQRLVKIIDNYAKAENITFKIPVGVSPQVLLIETFKNIHKLDVLSPSVYENLNNSDYFAPKGWIHPEYIQDAAKFHYFDLNKAYLNELMTFKWPLLTVEDDLVKFKGDIHVDNYYVISKNCHFAHHLFLHGKDELYPGSMVLYAYNMNFINKSDISYELRPTKERVSFEPIIKYLIETYKNLYIDEKLALSAVNDIMRKLIGTMRITGERETNRLIHSGDYRELLTLANGDKSKIGRVIYGSSTALTNINDVQFVPIEQIADTNKGMLYYKWSHIDYSLSNFMFIQNIILKLCQFRVAMYAINITQNINDIVSINVDSFGVKSIKNAPTISADIGGLKLSGIHKFDNIILPPVDKSYTPKIRSGEVPEDMILDVALDEGILLTGPPGSGKSYLGIKIFEMARKNDKTCIFCTPTHTVKIEANKKCEELEALTIDSLLGIVDGVTENKSYLLRNIDYVFIDEVFVVKHYHLVKMYEFQLQYKFKCILMGEYCQGGPYGDNPLKDESSLLMALCNYNIKRLNTIKRTSDPVLINEIYKIRSFILENKDFKPYLKLSAHIFGTKKCRRNFAFHRYMVDLINEDWIKREIMFGSVRINDVNYPLNMPVICCENTNIYKNGSIYHVVACGEKIILRDGFDANETKNNQLDITFKQFKDFKPAYAITLFKARGQTIYGEYSIYEWNYEKLPSSMLYVAISRATDLKNINLV